MILDTIKNIVDPKNRYLYASYLLSALYWVDCQDKNWGAITIGAKVGSTFFLALHSIQNTEHHQSMSLNAALVLHCAGDALIALPDKNAMLYAIPAFFAGHLLYSKYLMTNRQSLEEIDIKKRAALLAFTLCSAYITKNIAEKASGALLYAMPMYAMALGSMFVLACLQKQKTTSTALAALSYVIADILIAKKVALNRFIWPAYFLGQTQAVSNAIHTEKNNALKLS